MKKDLIIFLVLISSFQTLFAWDYKRVKIGNLYYNIDTSEKVAEVTSQYSDYPYWVPYITTADIPSSIIYNNVNYSVTSIGDSAFYGCTMLTSVSIGNTVTKIGNNSFAFCETITSMTIPNSVTSIGDHAFENCKKMISITIPNSVTNIGEEAFSACFNLTSVTIPNSVKKINKGTFLSCLSLSSVTIGSSVTSIGDFAFYSCSKLTSITVPSCVTDIGRAAFEDCTSLTYATIESEVPPTIGLGAFYNDDPYGNYPIYVPCNSVDAYKSAWSEYETRIVANCQGVESIKRGKEYKKAFCKGQIFILRGDKVYTVTGQELR